MIGPEWWNGFVWGIAVLALGIVLITGYLVIEIKKTKG